MGQILEMAAPRAGERATGPEWAALLHEAVTVPGSIHEAFTAFWNYSRGNQMAALWQCHRRGIQPGPLDTFRGWLDKGRVVRKGEKALTLCMPVTFKVPSGDPAGAGDASSAGDEPATATIQRFVWRPNWFTLAQTDGEPFAAEPAPVVRWDKRRALDVLQIAQVPFALTDGNCHGYACQRGERSEVAVSPVAPHPARVLFHELAHVVLGHTRQAAQFDGERLGAHVMELEAEAVAYIICEALGLPGGEFSRGYIQHWYRSDTVPDVTARRVFSVADRILKAGQ